MTQGKLFALSLLGSAAMVASVAIANPVSEGGRKFNLTLTGANEVPPTTETGTGTATITVNPGQLRLCWEITTTGFDLATESLTGAHIHPGFAGANGPILIPVTATLNGTSTGCVDVSRDVADAIRKAPQAYYLNIHTNIFPGGAIRDQLG